jgi:hypothetical protein
MERRQQIQSTGVIRETNTSQTCSDRARHRPQQWEHIWHTPPRRHQIQHVGNHPGLDVKAGACCVVVRNVDLWAPPPSRRRRCTSRPTDGDDARSLRIQQRRQCEGSSQRAASKLHKMYGHGTGATMDEQGPKQPWFHRGPDRQPAASTPHTSRRRAHAPRPHARASPKCW